MIASEVMSEWIIWLRLEYKELKTFMGTSFVNFGINMKYNLDNLQEHDLFVWQMPWESVDYAIGKFWSKISAQM